MRTNSFLSVLAAVLGQAPLSAQTDIVPFAEFLAKTKSAHAALLLNRPGGKARKTEAIEVMRAHVLRLYDGVTVHQSFASEGDTFDCIPVDQQPALRLNALDGLAEAPPDPPSTAVEGAAPASCSEGTIPMRRLTLEELGKYESLEDSFRKLPAPALYNEGHKYAHKYQYVNNLGASTAINIWKPRLNTVNGESFSLSQLWVTGGNGSGLQTVEAGWQVAAWRNTDQPTLFIYYTPDEYKTGCYNLDCGAFVQTSNAVRIGGPLASSTVGGGQMEVPLEFYLYKGNWWLKALGSWVGYYPGSLFRNGRLASGADQVDFGVETYSTGRTWPVAGSGNWGTAGYQRAAYHRNTFYRDPAGAVKIPQLSTDDPNPSCYNSSSVSTGSNANWRIWFFAGGPGGPG